LSGITHIGIDEISRQKGHINTTVGEHMPNVHRKYAEWTPERLVNWASKNGEATAKLVETILSGLVHTQQGFNLCLGVISLSKKYGSDRVEAASKRALAIGGVSYKSMKSILANGLDSQPLPDRVPAKVPVLHPNSRNPTIQRWGRHSEIFTHIAGRHAIVDGWNYDRRQINFTLNHLGKPCFFRFPLPDT